ncbi:MAG: CIA30 family protein [Kangiellaceae bacterium]|nr:CIA30 family protein [Kangiellaceae bacterium]
MKLFTIKAIAAASLMSCSMQPQAVDLNANVDDFSSTKTTSLGHPRLFMDDSASGGATTTQQEIKNGVITLTGKIVPARGQPGWASTVLLLDDKGEPQDASKYQGIRLVIKVNKGNINLSANSSEIVNYDYHVAPVVVKKYGEFEEIKVPFDSMKRAWSAQTKLNKETLSSISIVAWGMQPTSFDYVIDEVGFY